MTNIIIKFNDHPSVTNIKSRGYTDKFSFSLVEPEELYNVINELNAAKSTSGPIPTKILQMTAKHICVPLTDCVNNIILDGIFPHELKLADVIPVHKSKDPALKGNYRPISLLPSLSKIVEKILAKRITYFFNGKFSKYLCGFRAKFGTQHALYRLIKIWQKTLDSSGKVGAILMDLSKAFDTLPHDLLLAKLAAYGFDEGSLTLLWSYLSGRFQRVKVGSTFSEWLLAVLGVPQGSILGPLLFNIFINDLLFNLSKTDLCNFADDNTIFKCSNSIDSVITSLQADLSSCLSWFSANQLVANPDKFQMIFLGIRDPSYSLYIAGKKVITSSESVKLLGIEIDNKLSFRSHIESLCRQASRKINCLFRIRRYLNEEQSLLLSNAYILSCFNYCSVIWMFCSRKSGSLINTIHKRCLRSIYGYEANLQDLFSTMNQRSIHSKHIELLLAEVFKSVRGLNAGFMQNFFSMKPLNYSLRKSNLLILPKAVTTTYGTNSVHFQSVLLWNNLPDKIKNAKNILTFKRLLREYKVRCTCRLCK